jgi:phosphoglycerate dehydrogenase-like enzyme
VKTLLAVDEALAARLFPDGLLDGLPGRPPAEVWSGPDDPRLAHAQVLITGWGTPRIDGAFLERRAPELRLVVHTGGTIRGTVERSLIERGRLMVTSAAEVNARPTAEFALALIVLAGKRAWLRSRIDDRDGGGVAVPGLCGTTIGVLGASRVGRHVMRLLAAYDARILLTDPFIGHAEAREEFRAEPVDLDVLCRSSDIVTIHAPDLPETRHLLDARHLSLIRDGGVVVNTARGAILDTEALTRECATGRLDAALDVTDPEPLPAAHALRHLQNVLLTPHLAGSAGRELRRLGAFALAEIDRYAAGEPLHGAVSPADLGRIA